MVPIEFQVEVTKPISRSVRVLQDWHRRGQLRSFSEYHPNELQTQVHETVKKKAYTLFVGPNGIGKTFVGVHEAAAWAIGRRPWDSSTTRIPPTRVGIFGENFTHAIQEDIVPVLQSLIPPDLVDHVDRLRADQPHRWRLNSGTVIKAMSYKQPAKDFEGVVWDFVLFNEPPPRHVWVPTARGLAKRKGKTLLCYTAVGANCTWIWDELHEPAIRNPDGDVGIVEGHRGDTWMSEEEFARFERSLNDDEKIARIEGGYQHLAGRVYKEFDRSRHLWPADRIAQLQKLIQSPEIPKGLVIDPHDRKPFAIAWFLVDESNRIVFFKEWPTDDFNSWRSCELSVADYARFIQDEERREQIRPVIWRIIDPNAGPKRSVTDDRSVCDVFLQEGLAFDSHVDDKREFGHLEVKERLRSSETFSGDPLDPDTGPKLLVHPDCYNVIHALESYSWKERRFGDTSIVVEKVSEYCKDFADLVRYACVYGCRYRNPKLVFERLLKREPSRRYMGLL